MKTLRPLLVASLALCASARASQFVAVDVTYTHSAQTTKDSHYYQDLNNATPRNWVSPINYAQGTAYVRLEVMTKPNTTTATRYQVCFAVTPSYACTDQAPAYTKPGVYTWATKVTGFFQSNQVDWTKLINPISLILKDTNNVKPAPENVGATTSALYMPTKLRVTVTLVSPGATYVDPVETGPGMDAGTMAPGDAGSTTGEADAGTSFPENPNPGTTGPLVDAGSLPPSQQPSGEVGEAGGCSSTGFAPLSVLLLVLGALVLRRRARD